MITRECFLKQEPSFPFERLAPRERILFFDIETTGLRAGSASLYLIGTVFYEDGRWKLRQHFAEHMGEEMQLLEAFFSLIKERRKEGRVFLVSYNGDGFDLPFLRNCIRQYGLPYDFQGTFSLDLYPKIKPYRRLAGLADCRLKTVEKLCGIFREDRYTGGELIGVYEEYLRLSGLEEGSCEYTEMNRKLRDRCLEALLLHNAEDIMDMPAVMDILGYESLFAGELEITESRLMMPGGATGPNAGTGAADAGQVPGGTAPVWDIRARLALPLPKGIWEETPVYTLSVSEEDPLELNLAVTLYQGELRSFYADYKNYYYLPAEDYAIHKSVGEFVDRKARRQATAKTCYQRVEGLFVPQPEAVFAPMFYREYKALPAYGRITGEPDPETARRYVLAVLKALRDKKPAEKRK